MKFNGDLGPEKNQTHHERKNGKKIITSWRNHQIKQKHQNQPNNQPDEDKNPTINQMKIKTKNMTQM